MKEEELGYGQQVIIKEDVPDEFSMFAGAAGMISSVAGRWPQTVVYVRFEGSHTEYVFRPGELDIRRCRGCHRVQASLATTGDYWVEPDLCSQCAPAEVTTKTVSRASFGFSSGTRSPRSTEAG